MTPVVPKPKTRAAVLRWLTREINPKNGCEIIRVWNTRPDRHTDALGVYWNAPVIGAHVDDYAVGAARVAFRTIPDNDYECVRLYVCD